MRRKLITTIVALAVIPTVLVIAQSQQTKKHRRAKLPTFDVAEAADVFFPNVFDNVVGERPTNLNAAPVVVASAGGGGTGGPAAGGSGGGSGTWSKLIDGSEIENEIKALHQKTKVTTPTKFRSRDYKICRRNFSILAMLFGVIEEYDSDVRWKKSASALREAFARSAGNCKTGSPQAYQEAKIRVQDLQDTVGGGTVNLPSGKPRDNWENLVDRSPVMQRLESAHQGKLQPLLANAGAFKGDPETILHEAQMIALMSEVLMQEGMDDGDDDDYKVFCEQMKKAALDIVDAVKAGDYDKASKGAGAIGQACSECHENYRG